jgi:predicted phage tail protein
MDPVMQQFLAAHMQLIQNLTATIQNIQAQRSQPPPVAPPAPVDKHKEFMSHRPPTYSHSTGPFDADDWLKTVTKKLEMTQRTKREIVLYTVGCLEGLAAEWWNAYTVAHAAPNTITW